jgi:hypothetical protein
MQMAYTALQAWFLGSQVLARGKFMRDIFFVFAWELKIFYYFASENEVFMMFSPPGMSRRGSSVVKRHPYFGVFLKFKKVFLIFLKFKKVFTSKMLASLQRGCGRSGVALRRSP